MTWQVTSVASHVIERNLKPRLLRVTESYDVAGNIYQALGSGHSRPPLPPMSLFKFSGSPDSGVGAGVGVGVGAEGSHGNPVSPAGKRSDSEKYRHMSPSPVSPTGARSDSEAVSGAASPAGSGRASPVYGRAWATLPATSYDAV
jgi:hypothetical protein